MSIKRGQDLTDFAQIVFFHSIFPAEGLFLFKADMRRSFYLEVWLLRKLFRNINR